MDPDHRGGADRARRLRLIGGFEFDGPDVRRPIPEPGRRVIAYLAVHGPTARRALAGALWPDVTEDRASGSLRQALWRLGRAGIDLAVGRATPALPADVVVDLVEFLVWETRLDALESLEDHALDPVHVPRGELLLGWDETWVVLERERLHARQVNALELTAAELARRGRQPRAAMAALRALDMDPLREAATRTLIEIHLTHGRPAQAWSVFSCFRARLAAELDAEPSPELVELVQAVAPDVLVTSPRRNPTLGLRVRSS